MNATMNPALRRVLPVLLVAAVLVALLALNPQFPGNVGKIDFRAYWSASYLLSQGENFSDPVLLTETERALTGFEDDFLFVTWNPPWLLSLLLPYTLVSFERAVWWWILTNTILVFLSSILIWRVGMPAGREDFRGWVAPLVAFTFSSTLLALIAGQVNVLVLAGLALFLYFHEDRPALAGAALVLTAVKPHLVYLAVPLMLLKCWRERNWRVFTGFGIALGVLTLIVFILRPTFIGEYLQGVGGGNLDLYTPPSLGGFVQLLTGSSLVKWGLLLLLPLLIIVLWSRLPEMKMPILAGGTVVLSVLTMPFGWSYDFVVLLMPLLMTFALVASGRFGRVESGMIVGVYVVANTLSYVQRVNTTHEVYYVWLNVVIAVLYFWTTWRAGVLWN